LERDQNAAEEKIIGVQNLFCTGNAKWQCKMNFALLVALFKNKIIPAPFSNSRKLLK